MQVGFALLSPKIAAVEQKLATVAALNSYGQETVLEDFGRSGSK
jgi:hypothetical protein